MKRVLKYAKVFLNIGTGLMMAAFFVFFIVLSWKINIINEPEGKIDVPIRWVSMPLTGLLIVVYYHISRYVWKRLFVIDKLYKHILLFFIPPILFAIYAVMYGLMLSMSAYICDI